MNIRLIVALFLALALSACDWVSEQAQDWAIEHADLKEMGNEFVLACAKELQRELAAQNHHVNATQAQAVCRCTYDTTAQSFSEAQWRKELQALVRDENPALNEKMAANSLACSQSLLTQ